MYISIKGVLRVVPSQSLSCHEKNIYIVQYLIVLVYLFKILTTTNFLAMALYKDSQWDCFQPVFWLGKGSDSVS